MTWTKLKKIHLNLKFINSSDIWYSRNWKLQISFLQKVKFDSTQMMIQKYCLFLLKFDHFRHAAIFQCQKAGMIKIWSNSIISNHECANNPIISGVEVTHCLKNMFVFWGSFWFFWGGIEILLFCCRSRIHGHKFTPCYFKSDMNTMNEWQVVGVVPDHEIYQK